MTKCIYGALSSKEREFFMYMLPKPVKWFANLELDIWSVILPQIGFHNTHEVINDYTRINEENLMKLDYSNLISLAEELDYGGTKIGLESFYREGVLN